MKSGKSIETTQERKARLARLHAMTDEENEANIASDPDAQAPRDMDFLRRGQWVHPDGSKVVSVNIDARTARFFSEHHMDYQVFLSGVLKAFVASQEGRHD